MQTEQTQLPRGIERSITNRNGDLWYEYDSDPLFSDEGISLIEQRFREMRNNDYQSVSGLQQSDYRRKIRTKDIEDFKHDLTEAQQTWLDNHDRLITNIGNFRYGEQLTEVVGIAEEHERH